MASKSRVQERLRQLKRNPKECDVPHCFKPRQKLGRYCEYHDKRNELTGHPLGHTIRKSELRPYQHKALEFIERKRKYPDVISDTIRKALEWAERLITSGKHCHRPRTTQQRIHLWLDRLNTAGVRPEEVHAVVSGMYLMREYEPRKFLTDKHWQHQTVVRVFRLSPAPYVEGIDRGKPYRKYYNISVGIRNTLGPIFQRAFGVPSLQMIRELEAEANRKQSTQLQTILREYYIPG